MNLQHLQGWWLAWQRERSNKRALWKERPDLRQALKKKNPHRDHLPRELQQIYKQTIQALRQEIGAWCDPWIFAPPCVYGNGLQEVAFYHTVEHTIRLSRAFDYWLCQIDIFLPHLQSVMGMQYEEQQKISWPEFREQMEKYLAFAVWHRELAEELYTQNQFSYLSRAWIRFEQELSVALATCCHQRTLSQDLIDWYTSLVQLRQILLKFLQVIFIHELIHAWTQRSIHHERKGRYPLLGLTSFRPDADDPLVHRAMNEALTEWITERVYHRISGKNTHFWWHQAPFQCGYPSWIITALVEAIDHEWSRITDTFPVLVEQHIQHATDLLFTLCFSHGEAASWLKDVLRILTEDGDAFEKVSRACDHFTFPLRGPAELIMQSYQDLHQLFGPFLQEPLHLPDDIGRLFQQEFD
jgi:hypothetical protein